MRLTVRTLLAWRDRVLSEEDQRDLDEKVLSHDAAQEIEQRIERVLGNLDLPSPRVDAAGSKNTLVPLSQIASSLTFSYAKQLSAISSFLKCLGSMS